MGKFQFPIIQRTPAIAQSSLYELRMCFIEPHTMKLAGWMFMNSNNHLKLFGWKRTWYNNNVVSHNKSSSNKAVAFSGGENFCNNGRYADAVGYRFGTGHTFTSDIWNPYQFGELPAWNSRTMLVTLLILTIMKFSLASPFNDPSGFPMESSHGTLSVWCLVKIKTKVLLLRLSNGCIGWKVSNDATHWIMSIAYLTKRQLFYQTRFGWAFAATLASCC